MKEITKRIKARIGSRILRQLPASKPRNVFKETVAAEAEEGFFTTTDGRIIPIYPHHRYSMKQCWSTFGPVAALSELNTAGLLSEEDKKYLKKAIGHRAISEPYPAIRERVKPYLDKYQDLFVTTVIPDISRRLLKPTLAKVEHMVEEKRGEHETLIKKISSIVSVPLKTNDKVMEIGYTSGGESIVGFERLGFKAYGIDNFYYDSIQSMGRHDVVKDLTKTKVEFLLGDITQKTSFQDDELSLVYSTSVLEHIADLPAAFAEIFRILKPGGIMFHRYDPYFHIAGAHSLATLDSPWAHMRMTDADLERYIRELRPFEADASLPWIKSALNRRHTLSYVQSEVAKAGFDIRMWELEPVSEARVSMLTPEILRECLEVNPGVSIADLTHRASIFVAEKPLR